MSKLFIFFFIWIPFTSCTVLVSGRKSEFWLRVHTYCVFWVLWAVYTHLVKCEVKKMPRAVWHSRNGRCCVVSQLPWCVAGCRSWCRTTSGKRDGSRAPSSVSWCRTWWTAVSQGTWWQSQALSRCPAPRKVRGQHPFSQGGVFYTRTTTVAPLRWSSRCCKCIKCEFLHKLPNFYTEELFYGIICFIFSL